MSAEGRPQAEGGVWGSYVEYVEAMEAEVELLRDVLVFADGRSVDGGYRLADLYAADSEKQGVLERAGCHPRSAPSQPEPMAASASQPDVLTTSAPERPA